MIKITGYQGQTAAVSVSSAGDSASQTLTLPAKPAEPWRATMDALPYISARQVNPAWAGIGVNITSIGDQTGTAMSQQVGAAQFHQARKGASVQSTGTGNSILVGGALDGSRSYRSRILNGGTAIIYSASNKVLNEAFRAPITGGLHWDDIQLSPDYAFTSTSAVVRPHGANNAQPRDDWPYYFAVRGIDDEGNWGPRSAWVALNVPPGAVPSTAWTDYVAPTNDGPALAGIVSGPGGTSATVTTAPTITSLAPVSATSYCGNMVFSPAAGAVAHIIEFSALTEPERGEFGAGQQTIEIDNAAGNEFRIGDGIYMHRKFGVLDPDDCHPRMFHQSAWWRFMWMNYSDNQNQTLEFREFGTGDAAPEAGLTRYMRLTFSQASTYLPFYWCSYAAQSYYHVLRTGSTYRYRNLIRSSVTTTAVFTWGPSDGHTVNVNLEAGIWYDLDDTYISGGPSMVSQSAPTAYSFSIANPASGTPMQIDMARQQITYDGVEFGTFPPGQADHIPEGMTVRHHVGIASSPDAWFAADWCRPRSEGAGLHGFLSECSDRGWRPYIQLSANLPREEYEKIYAYLFLPVSSGHHFAQLREDQGQVLPWADLFTDMVVEINNEGWNGAGPYSTYWPMTDRATGATLPSGTVAGMYAAWVYRIWVVMPRWSEVKPKIEWAVSAHHASPWGVAWADGFLASADPVKLTIGVGTYIDGRVNSQYQERPDLGATYQRILTGVEAEWGARTALRAAEVSTIAAANPTIDIRIGDYETGLEYDPNNVKPQTEKVSKSVGAQTALFYIYMLQARDGFRTTYAFTAASTGDLWAAKSPPQHGGEAALAWQGVMFLNSQIGRNFRVLDQKWVKPDGVSIPLTDVFTLQSIASPNDFAVVVFNRNRNRAVLETDDPDYLAGDDGARKIVIGTGWKTAQSVTAWGYNGSMRHRNRYPVGQVLESDPMTGRSTGNWISDPNSVSIQPQPELITNPGDLGRIVLDDAFGVPAGGLLGGTFRVIILKGVR